MRNSSSSSGSNVSCNTRIACVECSLKGCTISAWYLFWPYLFQTLYIDLLMRPAAMCLSSPALKLFTEFAPTTLAGRLFQVVAILLVKNPFLVLQSLHWLD